MLNFANSNIKKLPIGWLRIKKSKNSVSYYKICTKTKKSEYIRKDNIELARKLAQRSYFLKLIPVLEKELINLENYSILYNVFNIDNVYNSLSPERQLLVTPIQPTFEQRIKEWKSTPYNSLDFSREYQEIYTNKGERVRSKSEKIYADLLTSLGIEYKYEAPLILKNGKIIYPDFTLIDPYTSEEVFWEHFGMMDNPDYALKAIKKIEEYERNGIVLGKNLIVTFEGDNYSTSLDLVSKKLIDRFILK